MADRRLENAVQRWFADLWSRGDLDVADRWGAFCFYDMFADLGLAPPFWELSKALPSDNG